MPVSSVSFKPNSSLPVKYWAIWRFIQVLMLVAALAILICLLFYPQVGLLILWNILIPVAPALFVVAPGLWRNICPLASTALLPRHLNLSKEMEMPRQLQSQLQLVAICLLYIIVPLRHLLLNSNGNATLMLLIPTAVTAIVLGFIYNWKSGWCASLCPVHPVEKFYGSNAIITFPNAHCTQCAKCSVPCPDSTPNIHPAAVKKTVYNRLSALLTIGGLPGFIWGWFQVPDYTGVITLSHVIDVYKLPFAGLAVTFTIYSILKEYWGKKSERMLISIFAATAVSTYYWYRIPILFGFGQFGHDGLLVNLTNIVPAWAIGAITVITTIFFFSVLVLRKVNHKSWLIRPDYETGKL